MNGNKLAETLSIHEQCRVKVEYLGEEKEPVIVIDNLIAEPELLVDYAATRAQFEVAPSMYPGTRAPAPAAYVRALRVALRRPVSEVFGLQAKGFVKAECSFSMVAKPRRQLHPMQRIPHFDSNDRQELAVIHYLCSSQHGGTSFYRHRSTGFEAVDEDRRPLFFSALEQQVKTVGMPERGYINGDTQLFKRIASYDAMFNRALVYRCTSLHSGNIVAREPFDTNPRSGRLSINTFLVRS